MAGVTTYSCTKCRPIDTEIIQAYEILTNTSKLVSEQEADRVTAEQGRVAAENERERVFGLDHGTATDDHATAVSDHGIAGDDHLLAVADHGTAGDDHTLAAGDHVTAGEDHLASTSATSRANDAAAAAEHMVDIHQGPPGADGTGITEIEQTVTSHANGGQNTVQIRTSDGNSYNVYIKNGSASNGLFPTSSALNTACPSPAVGDFAYVGSGFPADIYVCQTAGTWVDSGEDYDGDNVDLTDYATKAEVSQLEHEVHNLSGKYYGVFADESDLPDDAVTPGYAFVGSANPYAIWNFDGEEWSDSGSVANGITGEPGVGFSSIFTPQPYDGTMIIVLSNNDTITVDLNHNHPAYYSKVAETNNPSGGFLPDVAYNLGTLTGTVTFALAAAVTGQLNHYFWMFSTGGTAPTITWPSGITWAAGSAPTVAASKHYEVSILGGIAYYSEV